MCHIAQCTTLHFTLLAQCTAVDLTFRFFARRSASVDPTLAFSFASRAASFTSSTCSFAFEGLDVRMDISVSPPPAAPVASYALVPIVK